MTASHCQGIFLGVQKVKWTSKKSRHLNYLPYIQEVVQMTAFFPGCKQHFERTRKKSRHLNYQLYIREVVQMTAFFPVVSITCLKIVCFVEKSVAGKPNFNKSFVLNSKCLNESLALKLNLWRRVLLVNQTAPTKTSFQIQNLWIKVLLCNQISREILLRWMGVSVSRTVPRHTTTSFKNFVFKMLKVLLWD